MLQLARAIVGVTSDVLRLVVSFLRSSSAIRAENLVPCLQLARCIERGIKPRRADHATRVSLALFTRLYDWSDAVVNVRPATIVRWHRLGWRIFWHWKCRAGRPPIPPGLRRLIRRMAAENPLWSEERIANELLVKLGIRVSPGQSANTCRSNHRGSHASTGPRQCDSDPERGLDVAAVAGGRRGGRRASVPYP